MNNKFINQKLTELELIKNDSLSIFGGLNYEQINFKPGENKWSIGQIFDHIIVTNKSYFTELDILISGKESDNVWKKFPFLSKVFGGMLIKSLSGNSKSKLKAPEVFKPSSSNISADIIKEFVKHQDILSGKIKNFSEANLEGKITSPAAKFVTYSLKDTIEILVLHEKRHFRQAESVLKYDGFPIG